VPKLIVFNNISLDGYFSGPGGDLAWAHQGADDPEFGAFIAGNAGGEGLLVFGRVTYDLMVSYWPTAMAREQNPEVAEGMNGLPKLVFSRTLAKSDWNNTTVVKGDPVAEVRKRKEAGLNMTILGSGSLVAQLAPSGVIDEYQMVLNPVVLGQGRTMFEAVPKQLHLAPTKVRQFRNGKVLLCYERAS
jgi:dihydrofolate reductase